MGSRFTLHVMMFTRFIGMVSHELKMPLTPLNVLVQVAERDKIGPVMVPR
jgi:hypothetical protein